MGTDKKSGQNHSWMEWNHSMTVTLPIVFSVIFAGKESLYTTWKNNLKKELFSHNGMN
jgi:hypothetical protein